jgi:predicted TIM-barrel fold metal-dependent hydrolase
MSRSRGGIAVLSFLLFVLFAALPISSPAGQSHASDLPIWRADHHMHLASAELCALVGECLPSNQPPAVYAADAIKAMDEAHVGKGVILSCAYLYGLPSLHLVAAELAARTRQENEFTAAQVALYPTRFVGFLSVDPLADSAVDEIHHWRGSKQLIGLKLHFFASAVNLRDIRQRRQVAKVIRAAGDEGLPMAIHVGGGKFDANDAELFIRDVLTSAGSSWVQIAHAGAGFPVQGRRNLDVLRTFADHIVRDDPAMRRVIFDISYLPAPDSPQEAAVALRDQMRRIGMKRFVFGSDFNVLTPLQEIKDLEKLGLTGEEMRILQQNCAPWAC